MATLSGEFTCEICNNVINWYGNYLDAREISTVSVIHSNKNQVDVKVKPSRIPTIHCVELDCPFCGKHKEIVIKNDEYLYF